MIFRENILEIIEDYDYFILDLWGVIHDGIHTYPGVVERLQYLKKLGKRVGFLSNAPRRSDKVAEVLLGFGIDKSLYEFILTSGEATYLFLEEHKLGLSGLPPQGGALPGNDDVAYLEDQLSTSSLLGARIFSLATRQSRNQDEGSNVYKYYYIGPKKDAGLLDGLGYRATNDASQADFAVATGFDDGNYDLADKMPQLRAARQHNLPLICVNPDLIVVRQSGEEILCAGVLALEYQKLGGEVDYFGKPYSLVYEQVFRLFSIKDRSRVLAVGDGLETDILGANNNSIDSALVAGGIMGRQLQVRHGDLPDEGRVRKVCEEYKIYPKFVLGGL